MVYLYQYSKLYISVNAKLRPGLAHGLHPRSQISKKANEIRDIAYRNFNLLQMLYVSKTIHTSMNWKGCKGFFNAKPKNEIQKELYC